MHGFEIRELGTVKHYRADREYGFIVADADKAQLFVHANSVKLAGMDRLSVGDRLEFIRRADSRGWQAYHLTQV